MTKSPTETDRHVGSRIRTRRMLLSMSQEKLAEALGITFQQVQKYEKGINRVGASRLQQVAEALSCPVAWFLEGTPAANDSGAPAEADLLTAEGLKLLRAFHGIRAAKARHAVLRLALALAEDEAPVEAALAEAA